MKSLVSVFILMAAASCGARSPVLQGESQPCGLSAEDMGRYIQVAAGRVKLGDEPLYPEEAGAAVVQVTGFAIQAHEVTNDQFAAFVASTGYVTDAERERVGSGSAVFQMPDQSQPELSPWKLVDGATWASPEGQHSDIDGLGSLPVVHVSLNDARAYAAWAGGRLPTEAEWEHAARLALPDPTDQTSGAFGPQGELLANTWQGIFPFRNTGEDGFQGLAPVGCFPPDRLGLYDMIGNAWEWTETPYGSATYTIKGGSYLCARNFCRRYRPGARQPQEPDFSASHIGFRIVKDIPSSDGQFGQ